MSWDQGIQLREDLPKKFIEYMENIYKRRFGETAQVQYVTWFNSDPDIVYIDFGTEKSLQLNWGEFIRKSNAS